MPDPERFLNVEVHESEVVITVRELPTPRGPVDWSPDLELKADRIAKMLLTGGESILTVDVELKVDRSPGGGAVRKYRRPMTGGWARI